jgi:hypothetical protein
VAAAAGCQAGPLLRALRAVAIDGFFSLAHDEAGRVLVANTAASRALRRGTKSDGGAGRSAGAADRVFGNAAAFAGGAALGWLLGLEDALRTGRAVDLATFWRRLESSPEVRLPPLHQLPPTHSADTSSLSPPAGAAAVRSVHGGGFRAQQRRIRARVRQPGARRARGGRGWRHRQPGPCGGRRACAVQDHCVRPARGRAAPSTVAESSALSAAVCRAAPRSFALIHRTAPQVVKDAATVWAGHGLGDRVAFVGGNLSDARTLPLGADVYVIRSAGAAPPTPESRCRH